MLAKNLMKPWLNVRSCNRLDSAWFTKIHAIGDKQAHDCLVASLRNGKPGQLGPWHKGWRFQAGKGCWWTHVYSQSPLRGSQHSGDTSNKEFNVCDEQTSMAAWNCIDQQKTKFLTCGKWCCDKRREKTANVEKEGSPSFVGVTTRMRIRQTNVFQENGLQKT